MSITVRKFERFGNQINHLKQNKREPYTASSGTDQTVAVVKSTNYRPQDVSCNR
eukprot:TRINITY_DN1057_c0_g1_i2.p1 TRINITY_DN1057_c0_g1~~TRINITY_DN1057_c0_g1_i2.p1  ORF type:complete len:54 (+),score=2.60 TRINITY_DN1057_c0_g1_i2:113-274(+)